jgi:hypothetical protein
MIIDAAGDMGKEAKDAGSDLEDYLILLMTFQMLQVKVPMQ